MGAPACPEKWQYEWRFHDIFFGAIHGRMEYEWDHDLTLDFNGGAAVDHS